MEAFPCCPTTSCRMRESAGALRPAAAAAVVDPEASAAVAPTRRVRRVIVGMVTSFPSLRTGRGEGRGYAVGYNTAAAKTLVRICLIAASFGIAPLNAIEPVVKTQPPLALGTWHMSAPPLGLSPLAITTVPGIVPAYESTSQPLAAPL